MAKIGYARVSSKDQSLARQLAALKKKGVTKIFAEKVSGKNTTDRPQLRAMLDYIRDDDIVVVQALDRLGRNNKDLTQIIQDIQRKGAALDVINLPSFSDVKDPNLRNFLTNFILELYKYIAQEEREAIKERQGQGIAIAKKQGRYTGRVTWYGDDAPDPKRRTDWAHIKADLRAGRTYPEVMHDYGISRYAVSKANHELREETENESNPQ